MMTSGSARAADIITFTEINEKCSMCTVYTLRREGASLTPVIIDAYLKDSLPLRLLFGLLLRKTLTWWFQVTSEMLKCDCEALHEVKPG